MRERERVENSIEKKCVEGRRERQEERGSTRKVKRIPIHFCG